MIRTTNTRRSLTFGSMVVAVVMAMASIASACTVFLGSMTVQGNSSTNAITFYGNGTGMGHTCKSGSRASATSPGSVKVTVRGINNSCGNHKLPSAYTYGVSFVSNGFNGDIFDTSRNCMWNGGHPDSIALYNSSGSAQIVVDSTGFGTGTYNIPSGLPKNSYPDEASVCVSDANTSPSTYGNSAPLAIV